MCATSARISAGDSDAPNAGMRGLRFMISPPAAIVSYNESSGRRDIASASSCLAGGTGSDAAFGPSPPPRAPWQAAHHFAYSVAPSGRPIVARTGDAAELTGGDPEGALPGLVARYRMISVRVTSGINVRGIAAVGTTRAGSVTIAAMYSGDLRLRTLDRSGPILPPLPFSV